MTQITLTRQAIRDLRDLRSSMNNRVVPEILAELQKGWKSGLVTVRGAKDVVRDKRGLGSGAYLRLALDHSDWSDHLDYPNQFCIIAAGLRSRNFYDQDFDDLPRDPRYEWNGETGEDWDFYINGDYQNSPVVSKDQKETADLATPPDDYPDDRVGFHSLITQSPPGTGKTVTAADKACEMVRDGYEVIFLLPEVLIPQVLEYRRVKEARATKPEHFFIGTFHRWLEHRFSELPFRVLSAKEELKHLQNVAKRYNWSTRKYDPITFRDVLLYQIYVANDNHREDRIYRNNLERIIELQNIRVNWWQKKLEEFSPGEKCRLDYAIAILDYLQDNLPKPCSETNGTMIIVDEAQDYLLDEIEILKVLCRHWQQQHRHPVSLWLLGDLNQRIIPVDFDWGALHLNGEQETDWPDYRTTERILSLANQFKTKLDQISRIQGERWPPKATDPQRCFKKPGEPVKIIVYPDLASAESFLQPLRNVVSQNRDETMNEWEQKHSLLWRLATRARVFCSDRYHVTTELRDSLEFMPVSQAKGREFDACIAFCIFDWPWQYGELEAYTKWYTQLTRSRERLLIITTEEQLKEVGRDLFDHIKVVTDSEKEEASIQWIKYDSKQEVNKALKWITELSNDLQFDVTESTGLVDIILSDLAQDFPLLYFDLYEVLPRYKLQRNEVTNLECQMVNILFNPKKEEFLRTYLEEIEAKDKIRLKCLIYRGLGQSWKAASIAQTLRSSNPEVYEDIIYGIAEDLKLRKLPFEADRLLSSYGFAPFQEYQGLLKNLLSKSSPDLVPLLYNWVRSRLSF